MHVSKYTFPNRRDPGTHRRHMDDDLGLFNDCDGLLPSPHPHATDGQGNPQPVDGNHAPDEAAVHTDSQSTQCQGYL